MKYILFVKLHNECMQGGEKVTHDEITYLDTYCMQVHVSNLGMARFNTLAELSNPHVGIDKFVVCEQP